MSSSSWGKQLLQDDSTLPTGWYRHWKSTSLIPQGELSCQECTSHPLETYAGLVSPVTPKLSAYSTLFI